ncbi:hypothetical protein [Flagellimonas eckloniae]|uniref:hypothetical protein n=1 Tax=Flagellimonas eckloniae TaxID=346185 RepID=UPI0015858C07|nr:hypothetical protein [Allomuricauda eckloniae]
MRKTLSILAIAAMTIGMVSCEAESSVQETEDLFESIADQDATTGNDSDEDAREN